MEEENKKLLFCSYFRHIFLYFYSNFDREISLDVELNSASNEYPLDILFMGPLPKKQEIPENVMMTSSSCFLGIYCFWGSRVCQMYAVQVLLRCRIKFYIQQALLIEIWVKIQGDMLKIRTKIVLFFFSSSKINKYYFIILTIILLVSLGGPF